MTKTITDYDIQALVDHELEPREADIVRDYIEENIWAQKRYRELLEQKIALQGWFSVQHLH